MLGAAIDLLVAVIRRSPVVSIRSNATHTMLPDARCKRVRVYAEVGQGLIAGFTGCHTLAYGLSRDSQFQGSKHEAIFEGHRVPAFHGFAEQATRRLTLLANAAALRDLAALPGNRLEQLRGDRAGQYSIRINAQWRICFRWEADGTWRSWITTIERLRWHSRTE